MNASPYDFQGNRGPRGNTLCAAIGKLRDTTTGEEVFTLRGHTSGVLHVEFSPDSQRIASESIDRTVRVRDTSLVTAGALLRREAESRVQVPELPADPFAPSTAPAAPLLPTGTRSGHQST
jgi:WD40 repeat protein